MIKTFKKRFRSRDKCASFITKNLKLIDNSEMQCKYFITKSANGKKIYYHLEGSYSPKNEE